MPNLHWYILGRRKDNTEHNAIYTVLHFTKLSRPPGACIFSPTLIIIRYHRPATRLLQYRYEPRSFLVAAHASRFTHCAQRLLSSHTTAERFSRRQHLAFLYEYQIRSNNKHSNTATASSYNSYTMGLSKKRSIESPPVSLISRKRSRSLSPHEDRAPVGKRVKFDSNGSGAIKTSERYIDILRSDLDKPNMWYSRAEREDILAECEEAIQEFRQEDLEEESNYLRVFDYCSQSPSQESSDFLETAELHIPATARGIEWGWATSSGSLKRNHVRELLKVQNQIQGLSEAMRDRVLSSRSLKSSRPGRVMARLLGECDARNEQSNGL